ncbi:MAG: glycosyltransferase [Gammaproteobacteria bacterium]|nr:glycosyltransferase [Gammaproteobacteria bacterium]
MIAALMPRGPAPRLSIVVPAFNESKLIESCLETLTRALEAAGVAREAYECIVVDNNSTDDTATRAAQFGARVLSEPIRQIARARNKGGYAARGRWILFLDADSWPDSALIRDLLQAMDDPEIAGGGALLQMRQLPPLLRLGVGVWNRLSRRMRWAAGSFIFCTRDAFEAVNGFDDSLFVGEEISFCRRLKRYLRWRGQRLVILSRHPLRTSGRKGELYSQGEIFRVGLRILRHPRRFFRDPALCTLWYDGRR